MIRSVVLRHKYQNCDISYINYPLKTVYLEFFISPDFYEKRYIEIFGYAHLFEICVEYALPLFFLEFNYSIDCNKVLKFYLNINKIAGAGFICAK